MDELGRAERPERVRHELALAIAVHSANGWAREGLTSFVNGRADGGDTCCFLTKVVLFFNIRIIMHFTAF